MKSLSHVRLFANPWTVDSQAPTTIEFSRQECWSRLPIPSPGDLPDPWIEPRSPALQADILPSEPPGKPLSLFLIAGIYLVRISYTWVLMEFPFLPIFLSACGSSGYHRCPPSPPRPGHPAPDSLRPHPVPAGTAPLQLLASRHSSQPDQRCLCPQSRGDGLWAQGSGGGGAGHNPLLHASSSGPRPPTRQASGASAKPCLSANYFLLSGFIFLYLVSLGVQGWDPTTPRMRQTFSRILCASCMCPSCLQAPQAFHCSGIRPTAPHQNPLGGQGRQGLVVCWSDSTGSQKIGPRRWTPGCLQLGLPIGTTPGALRNPCSQTHC